MKITPARFDHEIEEFLVDFIYTDLGLVPPSHYPSWVVGSLNACLENLGEESSRKSRRKFRKFSRRLKNPSKMGFKRKQSAVKWLIIKDHLENSISDNDD